MSTVLVEELGPRGRRRVRIANIIAIIAIIALAAFVIYRIAATGNFAPELYEEFTDFETGWPGYLLSGLGNTIKAALFAMVLATILGFVAALGRLAKNRPVQLLARAYVEIFRSVPLLIFIFFAFLGLQEIGLRFITPFWGLIIGLTAYNSAVLAEIFRAGVLSLGRGQSEAASAIGLNYWQAMRLVILPQAVRRMTPAIVAQLATLTKDTSLGFIIGYEEFLRRGQRLGESTPSNNLQAYVVVGAIYFLLIYLLSRVARRLETQQRRRYGAGRVEAGAGLEDIEALGEEADVDEAATREPEPAVSG